MSNNLKIEKIEDNRNSLAPYYNKLVDLEKQGLLTSFGKMILSRNDTRPRYKFGATKREGLKKFTTEYFYQTTSDHKYKYNRSPGWGFGTSPRKGIFTKEIYNYYNLPFNKQLDPKAITQKWNKTLGGDIGCSKKMENTFNEKSPGPGRYTAKINAYLPTSPAYQIAGKDKTSYLTRMTGTNPDVSPCSYEIGNISSRHKFPSYPKITIGQDKRKSLALPNHTKHETYVDYSSMGSQMISPKNTEPSLSFGRSSRFKKDISSY